MQKRKEAPKAPVTKRYKKYHMDNLTFHLGVKEEEENVHVDDFIVVVQTEFNVISCRSLPIKEYAVTLHMEQQVNEPLEYTMFVTNILHIASVHISKSKSLSI